MGRQEHVDTGRHRRSAESSRAAILDQAARLATLEGLGGLSIARLADAVGMSKSGLFAHFGSKEELQLATVAEAEKIFTARVVEPTARASSSIERLRRLADGYLTYIEAETFPGGCFFASTLAEVSMQPGRVRNRLVAFFSDWLQLLETTIREAQADGTLDASEDAAQMAFEIEAALLLANAQYVITRTHSPIEHAQRAIESRLSAAIAG
jgi:AcrR family transcriptional regulator